MMNYKEKKSIRKIISEEFILKYTYDSLSFKGSNFSYEDISKLFSKDEIINNQIDDVRETLNHFKTFELIELKAESGVKIDEKLIKDLHRSIMNGYNLKGVYRDSSIEVIDIDFTPPKGSEISKLILLLIKQINDNINSKEIFLDPIELGAFVHNEFISIYPFKEGNKRTARMLLNYILYTNGYNMINIVGNIPRYIYLEKIKCYIDKGDLEPFVRLVRELERGN